MSTSDTARKHFEGARQEINLRMQQRDTLLTAYLGAAAAIFGISLSTKNPAILWLLPFLSLGTSVLVAQHHEVIGAIQRFLAVELQPFLEQSGEAAPQWNSSQAHSDYRHRAIWWRLVAHVLLIPVPAVGGCVLYAYQRNLTICSGEVLGYALCVLPSLVVVIVSHMYRRRIYGNA